MNTEAKVGAITLTGLVLLAVMILFLGGISIGEKGYPVYAVFSQVNGLKPGNLVRYAGVDVGKVQAVEILPNGVKAKLMLNPGVKVPSGAVFTIGADGLLGEKFINISPPLETKGFLSPNSEVTGQNTQGLDELMVAGNQTLAEVQALVRSLNDVLSDEKVKAAWRETAFNAQEMTANFNRMSAVLARLAETNEGQLNDMVSDLKSMSGSLRDVTARLDQMLASVDNNGQTANDLKMTIHNLQMTSNRIEKMAAALEGVVTDPQTAKDVKETLKNAREASAKANRMLTPGGAVKAETGVEVLYNSSQGRYQSNGDVRISFTPNDFAVIGVNDIGENDKFNFQVGKGSSSWSQRLGVIDSKAGVGIDAALNSQIKISLDLYDPNDLRFKLRTQYRLSPHTFLIGQADKTTGKDDRMTYFGLRKVF
ncbi:MAG TPA: MlaD family protein [Methylomusa anaerophila]|uniref:Mce related protein n=1 Tax=Methylomusa anaerophila TaxID=1930071 RepID=A0A348AKF0_9FIRM|nr:MlaD family protein [Methylomusa anaerophila]BBB91548.1 mce related protein [Methylomusa anaerophila]HML89514.1 MlaD family protein [Methylomusa anaerophila]